MTKITKFDLDYNITHFKDFNDYAAQWAGEFTREEFQEQIDSGFIQILTLGTYNGALKIFDKRDINDSHLIDALEEYFKEWNMYDYFLEENGKCDIVDLLEYGKVFTLEGDIYIDVD